MDRPPTDDRSLVALAWSWATRVIVIAAEMVVPGMMGVWIDKKLGTVVLFTLAGFALGMTLGIIHLVRMTGADSKSKSPSDKRRPPL